MFESILCQVTEHDPDVLESLIELAVEIAREGREGRRVGAEVRPPLVRLSMCATEAQVSSSDRRFDIAQQLEPAEPVLDVYLNILRDALHEENWLPLIRSLDPFTAVTNAVGDRRAPAVH